MHESQPDPEEREPEEHDSGFDVPEDDEPPRVSEHYPPTVASLFDAAGIRNPPGT